MNDAYLVHRDAILSVVERYVLFNEYIGREELAALLGIALPKKPPANPAPGLEALKHVLTPDYTPVTPPEPVKFEAPKMGKHDTGCIERHPSCQCNTCKKETILCCTTSRKLCPDGDFDEFPCPDYIPEVPHDPLP